jgi:hypothetical protein
VLDHSPTGVVYKDRRDSKTADALTELGRNDWFALFLRGMESRDPQGLKRDCTQIIQDSDMPPKQKELADHIINQAREDVPSGKSDATGRNVSASLTYWIPKSQPAQDSYR